MSIIYDSSNLREEQQIYNNYYIDKSNGNISKASSVAVTNFLYCQPGDTITIGQKEYAINYYDSSFTRISTLTTATSTAPENANYFIACCWTTNNQKITVDLVKSTSYNDVTLKRSVIFNSDTTELALKDGYTIYEGKELAVNDCKCLVDYMPCNGYSKLMFEGSFPGGYLAFYNDSNSVIKSYHSTSKLNGVVVPSDATKMKFGFKTDAPLLVYNIIEEQGGGGTTTYSITNNLTNVTNSNPASTIDDGSSYSATLTPTDGYTLGAVTITMGGSDITSTVYSNGSISISSVTGDIVIAANATQNVKTLSSISANYTQGSAKVYPSTSLDSLKKDIVVTATYDDHSTATITDYALSGALNVGTSTVTVSYQGKTTTFTVNVSEEPASSETYGNIVVSSTSLSLNENAKTTFTVKLDKAPTSNQTVNLSLNNSNCSINKTSLIFTSSNYSATQTVEVTGTHNSSNYNNLSSAITLSSNNVSNKTINVTINNIDEKPATTTSKELTRIDRCVQGVETLIFDSESDNNFLIYYPRALMAANAGFINPNANTRTTQLIPVEEGDVIKVTPYSGNLIGTYFGCKYDANRKYIENISSSDSSYTLTIDNTTKYLRFSYYPGNTLGKGLKIYIKKAKVNNQATSGTYINSSKILYNNIDIKSLLAGNDVCQYSRWNNKKWGLLGDSITESNIRTTTNYHHYIAERIHTINQNLGKSGNGFAEEKAKISELESDVDFITVFLGINNYLHVHDSQPLGELTDTSSSSTVTGQIISFIETLLEKFPATPIGFITPVPHSTGNNITNETNTQGYKLEELVERIKVICSRYSIPVLDLYHNSNLRPWISSVDTKYYQDGLHPNEKGHELISYKIQEFIETL